MSYDYSFQNMSGKAEAVVDPVSVVEKLFREAAPSIRLEIGVSLLYASRPLELRQFASILEDLASSDAVQLHHLETTANSVEQLRALETDKGVVHAAHQMSQFIPLLRRDSFACAELIARFLTDPRLHNDDAQEDWCSFCTYALHLALSHPAFNVIDKERMHTALFKVQKPDSTFIRVSSFKATIPGTVQTTSGIAPPKIVPSESHKGGVSDYVKSVTISDVRQDAKKEYGLEMQLFDVFSLMLLSTAFVTQVQWQSGAQTTCLRTYPDFFDFQC